MSYRSYIAIALVTLLFQFSFVFAIPQTDIIQRNNTSNKNIIIQCCNSQNVSDNGLWQNPTIIASIITGIFSVIAAVGFERVIVDRVKKRNLYFVPYTQWCIRFSGALHEFQEMCKESIEKYEKGNTRTDHSPTDIISHMWLMNKEVDSGYRWLSMVKKIDPDNGDTLDDIMDVVDTLWHKLEYKYDDILKRSATSKGFRTALSELKSNGKINEVSDYIRDYIINAHYDNNRLFRDENFEKVRKILNENVPITYRRQVWNWMRLKK